VCWYAQGEQRHVVVVGGRADTLEDLVAEDVQGTLGEGGSVATESVESFVERGAGRLDQAVGVQEQRGPRVQVGCDVGALVGCTCPEEETVCLVEETGLAAVIDE
jgi:hypothetical protein